ncbi:hypothetical protein LUZ60_002933 [Juncus effusus]|nr:hypothetical protein LUZ60_002933 [Juncus effusus]
MIYKTFRSRYKVLFGIMPVYLRKRELATKKDEERRGEESGEKKMVATEGGVMTDVLAQGRRSCYKARDAFYACLENEADKKPTEIATVGLLYPKECKKSREQYVNSCRPTWVRHFDRQYCAKKRVQRLLDNDDSRRGPITLPQTSTFKT